jgi:hypothetical protein
MLQDAFLIGRCEVLGSESSGEFLVTVDNRQGVLPIDSIITSPLAWLDGSQFCLVKCRIDRRTYRGLQIARVQGCDGEVIYDRIPNNLILYPPARGNDLSVTTQPQATPVFRHIKRGVAFD